MFLPFFLQIWNQHQLKIRGNEKVTSYRFIPLSTHSYKSSCGSANAWEGGGIRFVGEKKPSQKWFACKKVENKVKKKNGPHKFGGWINTLEEIIQQISKQAIHVHTYTLICPSKTGSMCIYTCSYRGGTYARAYIIRNKRHKGRQMSSLLFWLILHSISVNK